jgi:hypothetical protein
MNNIPKITLLNKPVIIQQVVKYTIVDRFPLPPVAPPIGDTSLIHVMRLAAHSTTSSTPTVMGESFIMTLYNINNNVA